MSGRDILDRLGHAVLVLLGVSVLAFLFTELAPGDYFLEMEVDPRIPREVVEQLEARYGVDRPAQPHLQLELVLRPGPGGHLFIQRVLMGESVGLVIKSRGPCRGRRG